MVLQEGDTVKISELIGGLQVLQPYYDGGDGYHVGAEHDVVYAYPTALPLSDVEVAKMLEFHWHQEDRPDMNARDMEIRDYNPHSTWTAFV